MFVIERNDDGLPAYFSLKVGRDYGAGIGGWTKDMKHALVFGRKTDCTQFAAAYMKDLAPFCFAVPFEEKT